MFRVKTNNRIASLGVLSVLILSPALAVSANTNTYLKTPPNHFSPYIVTLSLGPIWENAGETQTFHVSPFIQKTYAANTSPKTLFDGELFLGIERSLRSNLEGQLGLAVAATGNAKLSGAIWDDANPLFNNFNYTYNMQHTHIAVKGKILGEFGAIFKPYMSGSLGVGFNQSRNFNINPTIFAAIPAPNFTSNMTTVFTYTLGVGLQRAINTNWRASAGYEFADWGKSQLGTAPNQTLGRGILLNHLYTNGIQFSLGYCV